MDAMQAEARDLYLTGIAGTKKARFGSRLFEYLRHLNAQDDQDSDTIYHIITAVNTISSP